MTSTTPGVFDLGSSTASGVAPSTLIPPRRLGRILSSARAEAGLTLEDVAALSQGRFSLSALSSIERGTWDLSDEDARRLADMYQLESAALVPPRSKLIVDLDEGFMAVEDHRSSFARTAMSNDEILTRYLTMVYSMRRINPGQPVTLRIEDLDVLGRALRVGTRSLEADLESLMHRPDHLVGWRDRILKRRVLIPAAGVLVAALSIGALVLVQGPDPVSAQTTTSPTSQDSASVMVPVDVGTAIVQERNADGTPGETQIRTGAEVTTEASTAQVDIGDAATLERSGEATSEAGVDASADGGASLEVSGTDNVGLIDASTLER